MIATNDGVNAVNAIQILKLHLEKRVKRAITEQIIKERLKAYEGELRKIMAETLNEITFDIIENFRDFSGLKDEYNLWIKWNDKEKQLIERGGE